MPAVRSLVADAQAAYDAAVAAVRPEVLLRALDWAGLFARPLSAYRRVRVVAVGKAALPMAAAAAAELLPRLRAPAALDGLVVVPHGYGSRTAGLPGALVVVEAGHPVPDAAGAQAAERALALAAQSGDEDAVLVLVSGGGSSLLPAFDPAIPPEDARRTFVLLLGSGADIAATNTVRKHLSRVAGGRLALAAHPAETVALVLSDVVGDDPATVASGPTVADPSTFADAVHVVRVHGLWDAIPTSVRDHLRRGLADPSLETPKPGDARLARSRARVVGGNRHALAAAHAEAARRGYEAQVAGDAVTGEARVVGCAQVAALLAAAAASGGPRPVCLVWGGETTVTVRGAGRGGRNQELALAAALALDGAPVSALLLSAGTDGIDGPTDAAGAWATPHTVAAARALGLDAAAHLADNDAHAFFAALGGDAGGLLRPGPTHTNVMDVQIALALPRTPG